MRFCPFDNCFRSIGDLYFACKSHWSAMTKADRDEAHMLFRSYKEQRITLASLRQAQSRIVARYEGGAK